jgi:Domain of unknown function (DUF4331)
VPNDMLSADPEIGVWASVSQRQRDGSLVQVDRGGHPTINPFVHPNDVKDQYNVRQSADDVENYLRPWSKLLEDNGYTPEGATAAAGSCCPTSCATTGAGQRPIPTGDALPTTRSAPALPG